MERYEKALELFGIDSGFVDEHLQEIYGRLKEQNNPDLYEFLSPQYKEASDKCRSITSAYYTLDTIFRNYLLSTPNVGKYNKERLEEDVFRLLYDSMNGNKDIDEFFTSSLVEIIVSNLGLNEYVRRIEFQHYDKLLVASYSSERNCLIVYLDSIRESIRNSYDSRFSPLEKSFHPYCTITSFMRHEIEHAEQKRLRVQRGNDIYTKLSLAKEKFSQKRDQELERIVGYPFIFYYSALLLWKIKLHNAYRKYSKNWSFIPTERIADMKSYNLVLDLILRASKEYSVPFSILEEMYMRELRATIISGYDKTPNPAISYFEKMKQYDDCLEFLKMSKELSLEERLAYGLSITPQEYSSFLEDSTKVMQKIRMM